MTKATPANPLPRIFSYWEGPRPPYIDLCIKSAFGVLGDSFVLLTPQTINDWIPADALHASWRSLPQPALKADCIRAALLAIHGGWWWDADTVVFRSPLSGSLNIHDGRYDEVLYMTWTKRPRRVLNGYIYMPPGSEIARRWLERVNASLAAGDTDWCALGEKLLTGDMQPGIHGAREVQRRLFLPVDIDAEVAKFFEPIGWGRWFHQDTVCYGLNHSYFVYHHPKHLATTAQAEWRTSPLMIHRLLTYAAERYL